MTDRVIRIIVDPSGAQRGSSQIEQSLTGIDRSARRTSDTIRGLVRAAGLLVGAFSAREVLQTVSAYQGLQNTLRTVTSGQEELAATQERLERIANSTRTGLEATTSLYQRASIAAGELGASQEELFSLVEITGQALAIQGGSAAESAGALRQLSQSFSSGIVRAEEFNSILEGAFPIAQAAARGLDAAGGSVGRLRNLVVEGQVSSRDFFNAILEGGEGIAETFSRTEVTIEGAFTVLNNTVLTTVGRINEATGAGEAFAGLIIGLAQDIDTFGRAVTGSLDQTDDLSDTLRNTAIAATVLGATFSSLFETISVGRALFTDFGESLGGLAAAAVQVARGNFDGARAIIAEIDAQDSRLAFGDFFEGVEQNARNASDTISQLLLPSFRTVRDEANEPIDTPERTSAVDVDQDAIDKREEFIAGLQRQAVELGIEAALLDDSAAALLRYNVALEAGELGNEEFVNQALALADAVTAQAEALERAENQAADSELIESLEAELELIQLTNRERAIETQLRLLSADATDEQIARVRELAGELSDEQERLKNQTDLLETLADQAARNIQDSFADFLFDPFEDGLDGLVESFSNTLRRLAAEALAAQILNLILPGSGGLSGLISGGLGGGGGARQFGGGVSAGQPFLVGESGPELFVPPTGGNILPAPATQAMAPQVNVNPQIINVQDPNEIPAAIQSGESDDAIINAISRNPAAIREILQ